MDRHEVYCSRCGGVILHREELVTTMVLFKVEPYHEACYARELKELQGAFVSNQPVNGLLGNLTVAVFLFFGLVFALFLQAAGPIRWYALPLFFIPLCIRLYSWYRYEQKTPPNR